MIHTIPPIVHNHKREGEVRRFCSRGNLFKLLTLHVGTVTNNPLEEKP